MWRTLQEDGARAVRIVYNPTVGHIAICRNDEDPSVPWIAYLNDDYANRTGEVALYADTKADLLTFARFAYQPTCNCEHIVHEQDPREHPMYRAIIDPATARRAMMVGLVCDHCADTHYASVMVD